MSEPLSQHVLGRLVALFFCGVAILLALLLGLSLTIEPLTPSDIDRPLLLTATVMALALTITWWFVPWERWSRRASLFVLPVGSMTIATVQFAVPSVALIMAIFYLVLVAYVGLSQEPGWPTAFAPLAGVAFAIPLTVMDRWDLGVATVATTVTIACCLLGGEVLAWMSTDLRKAHAVEMRRQEDMQELMEASTKLSHQIDPAEAADLIAELAGRLLHAEAVVIFLIDATGALSGAGSWNWSRDATEMTLDLTAEPRLLDAVSRGLSVPMHEGFASRAPNGTSTWPVSTVVIPLRGTGGTVGVAAVIPLPGTSQFDHFTANVGQTFAAQAGLAFERVWATESLREATVRDELTKLGNRRHAASMLARMQPGDAAVMIDLDHFKKVNDELGHAAGDAVLQALGGYLMATLREQDMAARYGGEEFLVVLRQPGDGVTAIVQRLIEGWRSTRPGATFSAGVALHQAGITPTTTLARADAALYEAKGAGRDQFVLDDDAVISTPA